MHQTKSQNSRSESILLITAIILIGINLRPAFSSVSPVLTDIRDALDLTSNDAGLLTTLPVICLGLFAPFAFWLAKHFHSARLVIPLLLLLSAGLTLRGIPQTASLFIGTGIAGASIGILGILIPGIIKREFPMRPDLMTGLYTMALCIGTALAAGITVPILSTSNSLTLALMIWAVPALIAAAFWLPHRNCGPSTEKPYHITSTSLLCDPLAWQVTLFMGLQSALAYCVFGWLPSILQDRGVAAAQSGTLLSVSVIVQIIPAVLAPWLTSFMRDQKRMNLLMFILIYVGLMGATYAPIEQIWLWIIILGVGQGGGFAMALVMIVLRTRNAWQAAQLSAMSQGFGYTLAALGPFAMGLMHELTGDWQSVGWLFSIITLTGIYYSNKAGRNCYVLE